MELHLMMKDWKIHMLIIQMVRNKFNITKTMKNRLTKTNNILKTQKEKKPIKILIMLDLSKHSYLI